MRRCAGDAAVELVAVVCLPFAVVRTACFLMTDKSLKLLPHQCSHVAREEAAFRAAQQGALFRGPLRGGG